MAKTIPYTYRRGEIYWFRRRIPQALKAAFGGAEFIVCSLRTGERRLAAQRARLKLIATEAAFDAARQTQDEAPSAEVLPFHPRLNKTDAALTAALLSHADDEEERAHLTRVAQFVCGGTQHSTVALKPALIPRLAERLLALHLQTDQALRHDLSDSAWEEEGAILKAAQDDAARRVRLGRFDDFSEFSAEFLASEGVAVDKNAPVFAEAVEALARADARAVELQVTRHHEKPVDTPAVPELDRPELHLMPLLERWAAQTLPASKTLVEAKSAVRRFDTWCKGGLSVALISKEQVVDFRDYLLTEGELMPGTAKKLLGLLGAIVGVAIEDGKVKSANPFAGVKVRGLQKKGANRARTAFDVEHLKLIFHSPVYADGARPLGGGGEAAFWLPLLGLHTGARLEELAQLYVGDVQQVDDHWVIRICAFEDDQGTKNLHSYRYVPVHPELVRIGWLTYVERMRKGGAKLLFPGLRADCHGSLSGNFSKWWGRYLDSLGITNPRLVFNSFRHSFKHYGRYSNIPKAHLDVMCGHESSEVGDGYGGDSYPLAPLIDSMKRFQVPGLELSHLRGAVGARGCESGA